MTRQTAKEKKTALYCRLSKDDGNLGESSSIQPQKEMLTRYARDHGFQNISIYVDDGYSGTNFNRPDFQRLISDIENGEICTLITKDDCVKIGLNRKSLIESRFSRRSPISLTGKGATSFARRVS